MFFRKKRQRVRSSTWVPGQEGIETTHSRRLIQDAFTALEKKRTTLMLSQKGSPSSSTILLGTTDKYLLIDAPVDWKLRDLAVRIQFKGDSNLDYYSDTKIVYVKDEIIYVKMPTLLHRLQRRAHYRVKVPGDSQVVFARQPRGDRFTIRDISIGGMLCCGKNRKLARGMLLKEIDLLLPLAAGQRERKAIRITIPQGRIVRTYDDRDSGYCCYGIAFECGTREESCLTTYIRQRELELAKAGCPA